jgi:hypothetical protein
MPYMVTDQFEVRLDAEHCRKLEEIAVARGMPIAALVR